MDKVKMFRELDKLCCQQDWHHAFSDDAGVWKRGDEGRKAIQKLARELGDDGKRLAKAHYDTHFHPGNGFSYEA